MKLDKFDIVIVEGEIVQYVKNIDKEGVLIRDIHTKVIVTHRNLIERKATNHEMDWFYKNDEHIKSKFLKPKEEIQSTKDLKAQEFYRLYRLKTIESGYTPIGRKRFNGIIKTISLIPETIEYLEKKSKEQTDNEATSSKY